MVNLRQEANAVGHQDSGLDMEKGKKHIFLICTVGTDSTQQAKYYHIFGTENELLCQGKIPNEITLSTLGKSAWNHVHELTLLLLLTKTERKVNTLNYHSLLPSC